MPITCRRCGNLSEPMATAPLPGALGERVQQSVCSACWQEWLRTQVMIINEYRLTLADPQTRVILMQHMEEFLHLRP
ncbi:MAG: oxidative damage protection protein [Thermoanaerobaculum sp.]|nr:oxidative damage protection protein [Thermoanaerobaculum sp.]MDW7968734.1 oxidative damage protection protein [Thermoanaerobaculum sp.]